MPRVLDLMETGLSPIQSKHLGAQAVVGDFNALTAAGNNSQANAYQIEANYNIFTTVGATTNSAKLPIAESDPHGIYYILNLGANALNLFPAVGDNFNDLAANTAITIGVDLGVILVKQTITSWQVQRNYGAVAPVILPINLATDVTGDLPFSNLAQGSALSVLGVTGNATADNASIAAGTDHQVLRRSGTALAFGAVNLAQSAAVTGTLPVANGGTGLSNATIAFGTYTPTLTNVANLSANTPFECQYLRVGTIVTVSGQFNADAVAAAGTTTQLRFSLPVTSNFTAGGQLAGSGNPQTGSGAPNFIIYADATNDEAIMEWRSLSTSNLAFFFTFTYQII